MKRNTKKTLLIGSTSLLAVVLGVTVISHSAANGSLFAYRAKATGGQVSGSIVFSRDTGSFKKIDSKTASISGTTSSGATYYAISHNNDDITNTNYVAQFGMGVAYDEQFVTFSDSANGGAHFEFQAITGIKVYTTSSNNQTFYLYYSTDGTTFSSYETVAGKSSPEKVTFETAHKYIKLCVTSVMDKFVTKIELFYDCSTEPAPEPEKTLSSISVESAKTIYAQNGTFVEPDVRAHYSDNTSELVSGALFSGFDSSSLTESQTISVSFEGKETSYQVKVRPTENSKYISVVGYSYVTYSETDLSFLDLEHSSFPQYALSGDTVNMTITIDPDYAILGIDEEGLIEITESAGVYSFTMPNRDVKISISYYYAVVDIRVDSPKTSYKVNDSFVAPKVYAVFSNDSESLLDNNDVTFTGFNSESAVASQTITATYGSFSDTYTIEITEGGDEPASSIAGTYKSEQTTGTTKYRGIITLNDDGSTGTYVMEKTTATGDVWYYYMNISYSDDGNGQVTLTYVSLGKRIKYPKDGGNPVEYSMDSLSTFFDPFRPFIGASYMANSTNQVVTISNGVISMKRYTASNDTTGTSMSLTIE